MIIKDISGKKYLLSKNFLVEKGRAACRFVILHEVVSSYKVPVRYAGKSYDDPRPTLTPKGHTLWLRNLGVHNVGCRQFTEVTYAKITKAILAARELKVKK